MRVTRGWFTLPRPVRVVLGGNLVSAVGSGASVPYLFVYINRVCGLPLALAGVAITTRAVIAVGGAAVGGPLTDRFGARTAAVLGLATAATATLGLVPASGLWWTITLVSLLVIACNIHSSALDALLATQVPTDRRHSVFAWRRTIMNLGGAAGSGIAVAAIAAFGTATGLRTVFVIDGVSFAVFAVLIANIRGDRPATARERGERPSRVGYLRVLRDRRMLWLCVLVGTVSGAGFAQMYIGLPAVLSPHGRSVAFLGWMMIANMIGAVVLQAPAQRLIRGRRRAVVLAATPLCIAVAWTAVLCLSRAGAWVFVAVGLLLALAQVVFRPLVSALVNDLAPDELRGRYNAAPATATTIGWLAGTVAVNAVLATTPRAAGPILIGSIAALVGSLGAAQRLHAHLTPSLRRIPTPTSPGRAPRIRCTSDRLAGTSPARAEP